MRKFLVWCSVFVAILGYGIWHVWPAFPQPVEKRYVRSFIESGLSLYLNTLFTLERAGVITDSVNYLRGFMNMLGGNSSFLTVNDDNIAVTSETFAGVPVLIFKPKTKFRTKSNAIIYYHGGGFVLCDVWSHHPFTQKLALDADVTVFSVDYRLAPQFAYPAAIDDAKKATIAIFEQAEKLGIDSEGIFLAGESAGGNLATIVAMELPQQYHIKGLLLLSPWLQMANVLLPSHQLYYKYLTIPLSWMFSGYAGIGRHSFEIEKFVLSNSHVPIEFQREVSKYFLVSNLPEDLRLNDMAMAKDVAYPVKDSTGKTYDVDAKERQILTSLATNKRAWPLLADDVNLKKITKIPIYIQYARFDPLRDEAILFAHRLRSLGANVETNYLRGGLHGEPIYVMVYRVLGETEAVAQGIKDMVRFVKKQLT